MFICDTYVNLDPTAEQIAEITLLAAEEMRRFGIDAEGRAAVALELRQRRHADRRRRCAHALALIARARAGARGRRRDARRRRAGRGPAPIVPEITLNGAANLLVCRTSTRRTSPSTCSRPRPAERHGRPDPARLRRAGAHPDAVGDGAPHRQHDRADRGGRQRGETNGNTIGAADAIAFTF